MISLLQTNVTKQAILHPAFCLCPLSSSSPHPLSKCRTISVISDIKAAPINIFVSAMDQMTVCQVKSGAHSDEPTFSLDSAAPISSAEHFSLF